MEIEKFLSYLKNKRNYSDLTISSYGIDLSQFETFLFKDSTDEALHFDDENISSVAVRSWILTLSEQGVSTRSINRKISSLKAYFKWVATVKPDFKDPMLKIISPKTNKRKPSFISQDDIRELINNRPNNNDYNQWLHYIIVSILYATGIRQSEMLNLKKEDISLPNQSIRVFGKGKKERIIPIDIKLSQDIKHFLELQKTKGLVSKNILITEKGVLLSKYQLYYIINKVLKNYNIQIKSPHTFRHTCATHLIAQGADIINVKNLLGHSSVSATEVYTHTTVEQLKEEYKISFENNFE